jgi:hypothetical protein
MKVPLGIGLCHPSYVRAREGLRLYDKSSLRPYYGSTVGQPAGGRMEGRSCRVRGGAGGLNERCKLDR